MDMLSRARSLRKSMTPQELRLWYRFLRIHPEKFYKQRPIGPYIADFYCSKAKLVIEIDGAQHYTDDGKSYDAARTAYLQAKGLRVLRFSNKEVNESFQAVCEAINKALKIT